jgi:outer membrane protein, heavy metal efflux system
LGGLLLRRIAAILLAIGALVASSHVTRGEEPALIAPPTMESALRFALVPEEPIPAPPASAVANANRMTLAEAEAVAASLHPALREAEGRLRAARGNWVQVGLRPNPELGYSGMEIGDEGRAGQQGGFFQQEFVTANKLGLNRAVASREVAAAEQRYARTRLQLLTTVRTYYFEALAAERAGALAAQLGEIAARSASVSESLLKAGEGSRVSLLQAQNQSDLAALLEQQATNRREAACRRLASLLGMENETARSLEDTLLQPLPDLNWGPTRERVLSESPELAELRFAVERARLAVERARAGRVPNIDAQAGAAQDNATRDTIANVQISMPIPIYNRNQGAIAQACGELIAAQAALEQRERALEQRLAVALRDYATARQRVARYSEAIIPTARQALDITNRAYEQGELDYLQVLTVQTTYTQNNLAYLQDLEAAWKQWAEIEGLLVGPLATDAN